MESLNFIGFFLEVYMNLVYTFIITFFVVYVLYIFTVVFNSKKKKNIFETNQAKLIIVPCKLDVSKIDKNRFVHVISFANSFIVALTFTISEIIDNYVLKLFICFVLLIVLILVIYRIIGFIYKKREGR